MLERHREERIRLPVVERDVRRRAEDDEDLGGVDVEALEQRAVRFEVGEVVLLLQSRILDELRRPRAVAAQALGRDRLRDDNLRRRAAAELMLQRCELVIERCRAGDAQPPGRHRQLVGAVRKRDVEVPALRPLLQRAEAMGHLPCLLEA
jgi:hypothetical protein